MTKTAMLHWPMFITKISRTITLTTSKRAKAKKMIPIWVKKKKMKQAQSHRHNSLLKVRSQMTIHRKLIGCFDRDCFSPNTKYSNFTTFKIASPARGTKRKHEDDNDG